MGDLVLVTNPGVEPRGSRFRTRLQKDLHQAPVLIFWELGKGNV
jgi:hypothetical protein